METFQPILIVLLAALVAVWLALAGRLIADRRRRRRIDALLLGAEPRMRSRLMAIGDPSIPPGLEIPGTVGVPTPARPAASQPGAASTGRPALRNAAAGLAAMAILAGVLGLAVPNAALAPTTTPGPMEVAARPTEASAGAPAPSPTPVPTRVAVSPPSEAPMPSPTLAVTGSDPPPTAAPAGQDREPTASISCTFGGALTVSVRGRSTRARWAHWHFGDGTTVIGTHVSPHTYPSAGRYLIRFTVSNAHGSRTARQWVDLVARTGCS